MNCSFIKLDEANYYLKITNFFTIEELNDVWKELDFLTDRDKLTGNIFNTAKTLDGTSKSVKSGVFLEAVYKDSKFSNIFKYYKKHLNDYLFELTANISYMWSSLSNTNTDNTIVNYYYQDEFYGEHVDNCRFSQIIFLYKQPKKFVGGDFIFTKFNEVISIENNTLIMFPSFFHHAIQPVRMLNDSKQNNFDGHGRYSIVTFYDVEHHKQIKG